MPSCHNLFMCEWQFYCSVIAFTVRICIMFHKQRLIHFKHNHIVRFCLAFAFPANERIDNSQNEIVAFFPLCKSQRWDLNVDVSKVTNEFVFFFFCYISFSYSFDWHARNYEYETMASANVFTLLFHQRERVRFAAIDVTHSYFMDLLH